MPGQRIYVAIANAGHAPYTLVPSGQQITWGAWSALDVATGKILWQTADPTVGALDEGSVSVANGVMYAGSYAGQMYRAGHDNREYPLELRERRLRTRWTINREWHCLLGIRLPENRAGNRK